ncbi:MAG TPA: hypothetical protein VMZ29_11715 [Candidatus Bathyarchaeia archaeon]|nr:hypothetical protein [Candidatus Bathyarchaeia archaeon]
MTIESDNTPLSDFLLQVTQAATFKELESAYKRVTKEFDVIIKDDTKGRTKTFVTRYKELAELAKEILKKDPNGNIPSEKELAIFGEMVALRDVCIRRLQSI